MGWWWSSAQQAESNSTLVIERNETDATLPLSQTPHSPPPKEITDIPHTLTRDEQADAEFQSFLRELQSENDTSESSESSHPVPRNSTSPSAAPTDISPTSLYPTTISCRAAFDSAFYCQSLGGQFTNLYRYGTMRNCSDQWSNFWFCMRTNRGRMSDQQRMSSVQNHYRQRAVKYKVGPSSEDVWEARLERIEGAFEGDLEELERQEEQRKRQESGV